MHRVVVEFNQMAAPGAAQNVAEMVVLRRTATVEGAGGRRGGGRVIRAKGASDQDPEEAVQASSAETYRGAIEGAPAAAATAARGIKSRVLATAGKPEAVVVLRDRSAGAAARPPRQIIAIKDRGGPQEKAEAASG